MKLEIKYLVMRHFQENVYILSRKCMSLGFLQFITNIRFLL